MSLLLLFGKTDGAEPPDPEPPPTSGAGARIMPRPVFDPLQSATFNDDDEFMLLAAL